MAKKTITTEQLIPCNPPPCFDGMVGQKSGILTVISFAGKRNQMYYVNCLCGCGLRVITNIYHVRYKRAKSCGCAAGRFVGESKTKHGYAPLLTKQPRVYQTWKGMRNRCNNPNDSRYECYGGRGIKVCERWQDFRNFLADMGEPEPGMSIERKDNDKDYGPDNCIWIPHVDQAKNRRHNWIVILNGEEMTAREACRRLGLNRSSPSCQVETARICQSESCSN